MRVNLIPEINVKEYIYSYTHLGQSFLIQPSTSIDMPRECDWGRACNCSECTPELKEKCEICAKEKGYRVGSNYYTDRKGCPYYDFKTCCYKCYEENYGIREKAYFEMLKRLVEEQIRNPPPQKCLDPLKQSEIQQRLLNCFNAEVETIKWAQNATPDDIKIRISVSFNAGKERKSIELDETKLPKREDLKQWFTRMVPSLVEKISDYQGPIRFLDLHARCNLKGCRSYQETPAEARRRDWCRRNL